MVKEVEQACVLRRLKLLTAVVVGKFERYEIIDHISR